MFGRNREKCQRNTQGRRMRLRDGSCQNQSKGKGLRLRKRDGSCIDK